MVGWWVGGVVYGGGYVVLVIVEIDFWFFLCVCFYILVFWVFLVVVDVFGCIGYVEVVVG